MPANPIVTEPTNSGASPSNLNVTSVRLFPHRPNLGDKLQRLMMISPPHAQAVELAVDAMLKSLSRPA